MHCHVLRNLILGLCLSQFVGLAQAEEGRYAVVLKTEGKVEVKMGQADWVPAEAGLVLHENDEIRSAKDGTAKILLDKDGETGQFELNPESRLRLNALDIDTQTTEKTTILDLAIGSVLVHAEKLQEDSKFQVRTPNSTTGVRGTTFVVSAEPKAEI